jgi:hypothetical protein
MADSAAEWIAETNVIWVSSDGARQAGRIGVGLPAQRPTGEWACRVIGDAPTSRAGGLTIFGVDSMQALMLALQFLGYELEWSASKGGRALYPPNGDGSDIEFDLALLMGPLLRPPPAAE